MRGPDGRTDTSPLCVQFIHRKHEVKNNGS